MAEAIASDHRRLVGGHGPAAEWCTYHRCPADNPLSEATTPFTVSLD
jgi:hypothetical protein